MTIKSRRDFWSGVMFILVGIGFAVGAQNYSFGTSARPGPGYFPFGLGILLALLGALVLGSAFSRKTVDDAPVGNWAWRPLVIIVAAILGFGVLLPRLGMVVTLPLLVLVSALAGDEFRWRDALINAAVLTLGSWLIFIKGLGLTIPVWPTML